MKNFRKCCALYNHFRPRVLAEGSKSAFAMHPWKKYTFISRGPFSPPPYHRDLFLYMEDLVSPFFWGHCFSFWRPFFSIGGGGAFLSLWGYIFRLEPTYKISADGHALAAGAVAIICRLRPLGSWGNLREIARLNLLYV